MEALDILRCSQCDAPLALADGDTVTCAACGAANEVPAAYRELHRARIADTAARDEAEGLLRRLDTPPSAAVKLLARVFDQSLLAFLLLFGAPVAVLSVQVALLANAFVAIRFHYPSADDVPVAFTIVIVFTMLFIFAFVPRALGVYAKRRVVDRAGLLAALAARPPEVPGAAARCRLCSAPLAIERDQILAVCSYCRAENAVHLETELVEQTTTVANGIGREVRDAAVRDAAERRATRRKLRQELGRYLLRTVLLGTGFALASQETAERKPTTLAIISLIATTLLFFYYVINSLSVTRRDGGSRARRGGRPSRRRRTPASSAGSRSRR